MKRLILLASLVLFSFFSLIDNQKEQPYLANTDRKLSLSCPDYLPPKLNINETTDINKSDAASGNISNDWYSQAINNIRQEEYNITYCEETGALQSPNRANNILFTYLNNGFTAKTMQTKIPLFDVNDRSLSEISKKYKVAEEWCAELKIKNYDLGIQNTELYYSGNKAWVENEKIRIDYTNTGEGMRQDFIIKEKPLHDLSLQIDVITKLNLSVNKNSVTFSSKDGSEQLLYSSLKAWDANGKELVAYFEKQKSGRFAIKVEDNNAVYPVKIDPLSSTPDWIVTCDQQLSRYGDGVSAGDINGDGYDDVTISAPAYEPGGAVFLYFGSAGGPALTANRILYGTGTGFGNRVNCKGDINNDNYCDLIVGDPFNAGGKVWVYYGSHNGVSDSLKSQLHSMSGGDNFGYSVSTADVNGDGFSDVIAGCQNESDNRQIGAYVFPGSASGINELPAWTASVPAGTNYEAFYYSVSGAGDINNDGYQDIIVGTMSGYALIYLGDAIKGMYEPADIVLSQPYDFFGRSVSSAGDINSDGFDDVVVGSLTTAVFLYYGSQTGLNSNISILNSGTYSLSSAGDFNHDGFEDLITTGLGEGVYIYFGSASGIGSNPYFFNSTARNISNGDINGDGISDIIGATEPIGFGYFGSPVYTPPAITGLNPSQNAINISGSTEISVTFNQEINASTINSSNIKVYGALSGYKNCLTTYDAFQKKAMINPDNDFKTGEDITVTLTSGIQSISGVALEPFVYQFTAEATGGTGIFTEVSVIDSNLSQPDCIAAGDIDQDIDIDLLIGKSNSMKIYKNNGEGDFSEFSEINENGYFNLGDIDNDGDLDIIKSSNGILKTFLNDGNGIFNYNNSSDGAAGEVGDLDGDGDIDIACGSVSVEKNNNGIFSYDSSYGLTPCYNGNADLISHLTLTDFNNDGRLDISIYEYGLYCDILEFCTGCGSLHVFKNSRQNNFSENVIHSVSLFDGYAIFEKNLLLSFNKDNDDDVDFITPHFNLSNLGNEVFAADDPPNGFTYFAVKGDYDGDGDLDICGNYNATVYKNDGQGNFQDYVANNFFVYPYTNPVTADFDNDGSLDIALVKYNSNGVSILLNDYNYVNPGYTISGNSTINVGSTDNIYVCSAGSGYWEISNYDSTQASIPADSNNDTVLVSAGNNLGHFILYFFAHFDSSRDTLISMHVYVDNPSPVELTSFNASVTGRDVLLSWATVSEVNNSGFEIEKSNVKGQTSNVWSKVGFVSGNGTSTDIHNYEFTEKNLNSGKYIYRLKQIDFNGNFEYFELAEEVSIGIPDKYSLSQNYPNPFNPVTNLEFGISNLGFVTVKIYDVMGRELITLVNEIKEPGYYTVRFDGSNLSSGVYFYRMTAEDFVAVKKFVLMK